MSMEFDNDSRGGYDGRGYLSFPSPPFSSSFFNLDESKLSLLTLLDSREYDRDRSGSPRARSSNGNTRMRSRSGSPNGRGLDSRYSFNRTLIYMSDNTDSHLLDHLLLMELIVATKKLLLKRKRLATLEPTCLSLASTQNSQRKMLPVSSANMEMLSSVTSCWIHTQRNLADLDSSILTPPIKQTQQKMPSKAKCTKAER